MSASLPALSVFLAQPKLALAEVTDAKGSTPREAGTWMLVSPDAIFGTIGGGQLEYMAIDKARQMLALVQGMIPPPLTPPLKGEGDTDRVPFRSGGKVAESPSPLRGGVRGGGTTLTIPLGPEIGQCCGGRVEVAIRLVDETLAAQLVAQVEAEVAAMPHVYMFGGGHVGHALAASMALLPVRTIVVETRADELRGLPETVETRVVAMPEQVINEAPPGAVFLILTHDHALDFLIVAEALKRTDAAYVGMIGSRTKRATFRNWFMKNAGGTEAEFALLVSPIGGEAVKDKRPPVIAAMAAAEVMTALARAAIAVRQNHPA